MKKGLIATFMVALMLITVISSVSSKNVTVSNEKMEECNTVSVDNPVSSQTDNYTELITFIDAFAYGFKIKGIGLGFHIEIWGVDRTIDLEGYRYPLFPLGESNFVVSADHVIVSHFVGIWYPVTVDTYAVKGIALGNIDYS